MTKPWKPSVVPRGRRSARQWRFTAGEVRLTALAGCFLGLTIAVASGGIAPSPADAGLTVSDPWAVAITDGDTFRYRGERIRIADIDTPEVRGRCPYESRLAARATTRMEELLHAGPFQLEPIGGRDEDRYGRKLRVVTRGGRSLGDQLVAEGLARTWTGRRQPWCPA